MMSTVSPGDARSARCADGLVDRGDEARRHVLAPQVGREPLDVEALALGHLLGRVERRQHDLVGDRQRVGEVVLEDVAPAGRRARLERRDQLAGPVAALEREHRLADRRRVVREVVDDGDALRDAAHLLPPLHALEPARRARDRLQVDAQARRGGDGAHQVLFVVDAGQAGLDGDSTRSPRRAMSSTARPPDERAATSKIQSAPEPGRPYVVTLQCATRATSSAPGDAAHTSSMPVLGDERDELAERRLDRLLVA